MIYGVEDKNNTCLNHRLMGKFHRLLHDLELSELFLHGHLFTWSNEQQHPTLSHIDRASRPSHGRIGSLIIGYERPPHAVQTMPPLVIHTNLSVAPKRHFKFESIWPRFQGYMEAVTAGWQCNLQNADPLEHLIISSTTLLSH
jgi:hypothetical protein